jgi:hypothetical protein
MHTGSDIEMNFDDASTWNDYGFNRREDNWAVRILDNKIWGEALLVPPSMIDEEELAVDANDMRGNMT